MAGSDQSVNLGGMLNQIGKTVGGMGEAYKPVSQALSKPRGDMSDPAHLQRLAQWASSNGDSASASMYMQQARQLKAEQKEKQAMESMAVTSGMSASAQRAIQDGNVEELDRLTASLRERSENPTSIQGLQASNRALQEATQGRTAAVNKQTDNRANAIMQMDAMIESGVSPNGQPVDVASLKQARDELASFEGVNKLLGEKQMEAWDAERAQIQAEADQYVVANSDALYSAIESGDTDAEASIIENAPFAARKALQAKADTERTYSQQIADREYLFAETSKPFDMKSIQADIDALPPEYHDQFKGLVSQMETVEKYRINGTLPDGMQTRYINARDALQAEFKAVARSQGNAEYQRRLAEESQKERGIEELSVRESTIDISSADVRSRARELAMNAGRDGGGYVTTGRGARRRETLNIDAFVDQARTELENEAREDIRTERSIRYPDAPGSVAPGGPEVTPPASTGDEIPTVTTQAEFDALSSGDVFIQNGQRRRKP